MPAVRAVGQAGCGCWGRRLACWQAPGWLAAVWPHPVHPFVAPPNHSPTPSTSPHNVQCAADDAKAGTMTLPTEQMDALPAPGEVDFICGA